MIFIAHQDRVKATSTVSLFFLTLKHARVPTRRISRCDTCFVPVYLSFFWNRSPRIEFGYARFLLIRHTRPDVTSLKLRGVLIVDARCDLTPGEFCLLVVIHSRYRDDVTSLLRNKNLDWTQANRYWRISSLLCDILCL